MLKIPKGLKKKKKGKKGKHKGDEDLFTPEELEEYKRQKALREQQEHQEAEASQACEEGGADAHAGSSSGSAAPENGAAAAGATAAASAAEDEDRLQALLGGVDSILNKTQRDLERIKSTSFFQRKPTPSELESKRAQGPPSRPSAPSAAAVASASTSKKGKKRWVGFEGDGDEEDSEDEHPQPAAPPAAAAEAAFEPAHENEHEEEEESEEEEDDGDDIFDTSYIDVITSGEVKLAYIPDSPTEQPDDGDDPFDTTYAAKVIGNDEDIKKRQKLEKVSLGIAVDVLTGKAAPPSKPPPLPENAVAKRAVPRRVKPVDLLKLGSFDEGSTPAPGEQQVESEAQPKADEPKSLLDDDALLAIPEDLPPVGTPIIPPASIVPAAPAPSAEEPAQEEKKPEDKQIDLSEFDVIAEKPAVPLPISNLVLVAAALGGPPATAPEEEDDELEDEFAALAQESLQKRKEEEDEFAVDGDDPFDTSAAAVVLGEPDEPVKQAKPTPDVDVLLAGPQATWSAFEDDDHPHPQLKPSRPPPPRPAAPHTAAHAPAHEDAEIDPFDTSFAQNILPGKTELKLIEKEILSDHNEARILSNSDSDFDFNPREGEEPRQSQQQSQVSFYVTDPAGLIDNSPVVHRDLLGGSTSDLSQLGHEPIAADAAKGEEEEATALHDDPFDTSAVEAVAAPGRTELRYLEKEILGDTPAVVADDDDFDPRAEEAKNKVTRPDALPGVPKTVAFALPSPAPDLLAGGEEVGAKFSKPLTPYYAEQAPALSSAAEVDPFDTTHVTNLAPGKTELKILESELVDGSSGNQSTISDEEFDPRGAQFQTAPVGPKQDLFNDDDCENVGHRPLTPAVEEATDIDPFDTSIASNIAPGKAELKVLENELISGDPQPSIKRTYTDPDFNPRDDPSQSAQDLLNEPAEPLHGAKPLTPVFGEQTSLENAENDIDPFDTSIAADIGPGKTELRILESELIGQQ
ncbi:Protein stoned-A [Frankliniella fusca]|uniref:Protein stoned-A n=1 Tax=Frankliniella fusca TaxID=407009 RepID=A0AAE1LCW4_9NEOP|nr:Protein stoned-A [Frankliniella fusca]